jgi:hypothetical protein
MGKTQQQKAEARVQNLKATADINVALARFRSHLQTDNIACLDAQFKDELVDIRYNLLKTLQEINPIVDEGIRSISAQSVSGRLAPKG